MNFVPCIFEAKQATNVVFTKAEIRWHAVQVGRECRNRGGQTKGKVLNDEAHVKMFIFGSIFSHPF